jgi:hypothetical protein
MTLSNCPKPDFERDPIRDPNVMTLMPFESQVQPNFNNLLIFLGGTRAFHACDRGSNPLGDAKYIGEGAYFY